MPPRAAQKEFERCRRTSDQYTLAALEQRQQLRPVSATPPLTSLLLPLSLYRYFAYNSVHKYTDDPFTALSSDTVFCIARYLLSWLLKVPVVVE